MTGTFTLNRLFRMSIRLTEEGLFSIAAQDDTGRKVEPDELVSFLFFSNERALFGLLANTDAEVAYLQADQLLQVFSIMHPYVIFEGLTDEDDTQLAFIREATVAWTDPDLWNYAEVDGTTIRFDGGKTGISEGAAAVISQAVSSKLATSAINPDLLASLLPHLRTYGWPGESVSTMPINVAFRLTEPEAESDTEWLLETVIIGERGTHWTPAARKVNAPAADALPAKWKPYAEDIVKKQSEMTSFLGSVDLASSESFLSTPMSDPEVRTFIKDDLPLASIVRLSCHPACMAEIGDRIENAYSNECRYTIV